MKRSINKTQIISSAIGVAVAMTASHFVNANIKERDLAKFQQELVEWNKRLPQKVEDYTTLTSVKLEKSHLKYVYNVTSDKIDPTRFSIAMNEQLKQMFCTNKDMEAIRHHFDVSYLYYDNSKRLIDQFEFPKGYCKP